MYVCLFTSHSVFDPRNFIEYLYAGKVTAGTEKPIVSTKILKQQSISNLNSTLMMSVQPVSTYNW